MCVRTCTLRYVPALLGLGSSVVQHHPPGTSGDQSHLSPGQGAEQGEQGPGAEHRVGKASSAAMLLRGREGRQPQVL